MLTEQLQGDQDGTGQANGGMGGFRHSSRITKIAVLCNFGFLFNKLDQDPFSKAPPPKSLFGFVLSHTFLQIAQLFAARRASHFKAFEHGFGACQISLQ